MSSLLRSTKLMRYLANASRNIKKSSHKSSPITFTVTPKPLSAAHNVTFRCYATQKAERLEPLLQKADNEVRRSGRISLNHIEEIFNEIKQTNDITSSQALFVIRCCGELVPEETPEQRTLLAQKLWSTFKDLGVPMDISHYNTLLKVYIENEHQFSPAAFLEELEAKGLEPNRVTYQRLMWRYCQEGDVEGATKILERMRELQMPVSEPVLNALVMGHAFLGDTDGAKAVLETMAGAGLQPSNRTYALLACGYAKKGNIDHVMETLKTANDKEAFLSNRDIVDVIEALASSGQSVDAIAPLLEMLKPNSVGYNQDHCNSIIRLINKGHIDVAKLLIKNMAKGRRNQSNQYYQGNFIIKQLLKVHKSPEEVIKVCQELQNEDLVPNATYLATEYALQNCDVEIALALFKELQRGGSELRPHYYWPLLIKKGKENDEEGLIQLLKAMTNNDVAPNSETLTEYVLPYLKSNEKQQNVITKLQLAGISPFQAARSVIIDLLDSGNIKDAAYIMSQYRPFERLSQLSRPLINALNKTKDVDSFVTIVHHLKISTETESAEEGRGEGKQLEQELHQIIRIAVKQLPKPEMCEKFLTALYAKGIGINTATAEAIEKYLGDKLTPVISETLTKLTSPDLEVAPLSSPRRINTARGPAQLQRLLNKTSGDETTTSRLQNQLLIAHMKDDNKEKVYSLLEQYQAEKVELTAPTLASLFEFYCINNEVDKALKLKSEMDLKYPDFHLNTYKLLEMAFALVRANRLQEAVEFLDMNSPHPGEESPFPINTKCWQILNALAETKDADKVIKMTNIMLDKNYAAASNVLLGPSIKVHLLNKDMEKALQQLEHCCKQYRCTPWKGELMKALILEENASKLQWLADMSTQVHGESNTLHDLVFAFVECGRLRQARRILETPGLYTKQKRVDAACQRYVNEGKSEYLEGLLEATKELSNIDRSNIFYHLLLTYCKADETDKALGLWTLLQEEGQVPSSEFLSYLARHLRQKGREVPFIAPNSGNQDKQYNKATAPRIEFTPELFDDMYNNVMKAESEEDVKKALRVFPRKRSIVEVIESKQLLGECEKIAKAAASKGVYFPSNILWTEYLIRNQHKEAEDIWNSTLVNSTHLSFERLIQHCYTTNQTELLEKVVSYTNLNKNVTLPAKGYLYSKLIKLYLTNKDLQRAKVTLNKAQALGITEEQIGHDIIESLNQFEPQINVKA